MQIQVCKYCLRQDNSCNKSIASVIFFVMFALRDFRLLLRLIRDFDLVNLVITGSFVIAAFYGKQSLFEVFMQLCVEWRMKIVQLLKESYQCRQVCVLVFTQLFDFKTFRKKNKNNFDFFFYFAVFDVTLNFVHINYFC